MCLQEWLFECLYLFCLIVHLEESLFGEDFNSPLQGHHMLEALSVHVQDLIIIEIDGNFQNIRTFQPDLHASALSEQQSSPS